MAVYRDTTTSRVLTTATLFRAWASMISKGLEEVGLVQTADTGQINLATVELPSVSTTAGYQIWRFNDSNQGVDPIFLKIEYGLGTTTSRPRLICSCGTGSNGSGTLTNATENFFGSITNTASGTAEFHVCHVDGCLVFMESAVESQTSTNTYLFFIERMRDSKGAPITSGSFMGWMVSCTAATAISRMRRNNAYANAPVQYLGCGTGANADGRKLMAPLITKESNYFIGILAALAAEISFQDTGKATLYGVERSYRAQSQSLPTTNPSTCMGGLSGETHRLLLLNE